MTIIFLYSFKLSYFMTNQEKLKEIISYMQDKGFVYGPSPEIYGGVAGFYDYGPLGKLLKNNIENTIRSFFQKNQFFEVECPTVMPDEVWKASGHLEGFTDPVIKDKNGNVFRVDKLIEEYFHSNNLNLSTIKINGAKDDELLDIIKTYKIKSPMDGSDFEMKIIKYNLMMKTTIGLDKAASNRPETATTTYLPFLRYLNFFREKLPFGVFQIGKAYRNEISPRQFILRMREFTQAEGQLFIFKDQKDNFEKYERIAKEELPLLAYNSGEVEKVTIQKAIEKKYIKNKAYAWALNLAYTLFKNLGIPSNKMRLRQHNPNERAFYADDAWDLEILTNTFGWVECCGIHDRTDYDLKTHGKASKTELVAKDETHEKQVPHIIEIAFGTDRPVFALIDIFYELKEKEEGKTILKIPYHLAPIKVGVFPLVNKLDEEAQKVFEEVQNEFVTIYEKGGSIGKRYLKADSIGIPYSITFDFDSLERKDVTIRDRDSTLQKRVKIKDLNEIISKLLKNKISFEELK